MNKKEILKMLNENMKRIQDTKEVSYKDICELYAALIFVIAFGFGDMKGDVDVKNV